MAGIRLLTQDLMRSGRQVPQAPADPEVLAELDAAAERATHLVQQLLSLARAEAGAGAAGAGQGLALDALAESLVAKWQRAAARARKPLLWCGPPAGQALPRVQADAQVLQDALDNLIDNALLHGGPHCELRVLQQGDWVCCEVRDDGPPLPETTLERMRAPFWRAGDAQRPGTGLGVSIAEKAAAAFGGRLEIERCRPGPQGAASGTCVRLCLPARPGPAAL